MEELVSSEVQRVHNQQRPRTARVNTLKMSVADAVDWLRSPHPEHGCQPLQVLSKDIQQCSHSMHTLAGVLLCCSAARQAATCQTCTGDSFLASQMLVTTCMTVAQWRRRSDAQSEACTAERGAALQEVSVDPLLPDVLHLPAGTDMHDHPLVKSTCLILQVASQLVRVFHDMHIFAIQELQHGNVMENMLSHECPVQSKSSCMPAHALRPEPGWEVLDACAAPGNKTTHVAGGLLHTPILPLTCLVHPLQPLMVPISKGPLLRCASTRGATGSL